MAALEMHGRARALLTLETLDPISSRQEEWRNGLPSLAPQGEEAMPFSRNSAADNVGMAPQHSLPIVGPNHLEKGRKGKGQYYSA